MRLTAIAVCLISVVNAADALPQTDRSFAVRRSAEFDTASIRRVDGDPSTMRAGGTKLEGGRFTASNVTLRALIELAYQPFEERTFGGPRWVDTDRFEIVAKMGRPERHSDLPTMIQSMLRDRFKLATHEEIRTIPVFELSPANQDRRLGRTLRRSDVDCAALAAAKAKGATIETMTQDGRPVCGVRVRGGATMQVLAGAVEMSQFVRSLGRLIEHPVLDRTTLTGRFDVELRVPLVSVAKIAKPGLLTAAIDAADAGPSLSDAMRDQLGLVLDQSKAPLKVLVVDHVELPAAD